jgi:hypothetical protein
MLPYFLWSLPGLVSRIASSAMYSQSNSQSQVVHVQNSHPDIYRISLRCLNPPKSDSKKVCAWYRPNGSSQQPKSYVNPLPWFTHVAFNLHNDQVVQCAICKIFSNAGENRAHTHTHMPYVLHPCQCPVFTVKIIHTPAYRNHWAQHPRQYSLAEIDLDTSEQPIALKLRDKFRLPLRLPEGNKLEDFHKAAYTSWNAPVRSRTPMEELRLQNSVDPTCPARLIRTDVNPYYDAASDIGSVLGAEVVADWDNRLDRLFCVGMRMSVESSTASGTFCIPACFPRHGIIMDNSFTSGLGTLAVSVHPVTHSNHT